MFFVSATLSLFTVILRKYEYTFPTRKLGINRRIASKSIDFSTDQHGCKKFEQTFFKLRLTSPTQTILITIITQGARVPQELRGNLKGSLVLQSHVVDAIGTIALYDLAMIQALFDCSLCSLVPLFAVCSTPT